MADEKTTPAPTSSEGGAAPKAEKTAAAPAEPKSYVVKVEQSVFDDEGKLRERGEIFVTTRAELIGREVSDATRTAETILDEDQKAILKLAKG